MWEGTGQGLLLGAIVTSVFLSALHETWPSPAFFVNGLPKTQMLSEFVESCSTRAYRARQNLFLPSFVHTWHAIGATSAVIWP